MIDKGKYEHLINAFDMGTSTAERDPLLPSAQILTQEFSDMVVKDRIDLVRGIKGSGKTALYRVLNIISENQRLEKEKKLYCIFGVEATGDPVFKKFKKDLAGFSISDFEKFWMLYFLSLIRDELNNNPSLKTIITSQEDAKSLEEFWKELEVPYEKTTSLIKKVQNVIDRINVSAKLGVEFSPTGAVGIKPEISLQRNPLIAEYDYKEPKYVGDFRNKLCGLLKKSGFRIWILLDRLDEVFERRTKVEENGLKGLLKVSYNLSDESLRIKIFLRDDIINQLANSENGFTALTHVTDRASSPMRWSKENILYLIVKRLSAMPQIQEYYNIESSKLEKIGYCEQCFYKVFPSKIGKYSTWDWIMNMLSDGKEIVTPRDVIDLLNIAKAIEFKQFSTNKEDKEFLITKKSLVEALDSLSQDKKDKYLMAEFPHMKDSILKLEGKYSIYNSKSLEELFGLNWNKIVADFVSIGLLKHDAKKGWYRIPKIWIKGLKIIQGKNFDI